MTEYVYERDLNGAQSYLLVLLQSFACKIFPVANSFRIFERLGDSNSVDIFLPCSYLSKSLAFCQLYLG